MTAQKRDQLKAAYLVVFDDFAVGRSDVAEEIDVSKDVATRLLKQLESDGLITGEDVNEEAQGRFRRGQYKEIVWQCWQSYDSISREEAEALFDETYPPAAAAPAPRRRRQTPVRPGLHNAEPVKAPEPEPVPTVAPGDELVLGSKIYVYGKHQEVVEVGEVDGERAVRLHPRGERRPSPVLSIARLVSRYALPSGASAGAVGAARAKEQGNPGAFASASPAPKRTTHVWEIRKGEEQLARVEAKTAQAALAAYAEANGFTGAPQSFDRLAVVGVGLLVAVKIRPPRAAAQELPEVSVMRDVLLARGHDDGNLISDDAVEARYRANVLDEWIPHEEDWRSAIEAEATQKDNPGSHPATPNQEGNMAAKSSATSSRRRAAGPKETQQRAQREKKAAENAAAAEPPVEVPPVEVPPVEEPVPPVEDVTGKKAEDLYKEFLAKAAEGGYEIITKKGYERLVADGKTVAYSGTSRKGFRVHVSAPLKGGEDEWISVEAEMDVDLAMVAMARVVEARKDAVAAA